VILVRPPMVTDEQFAAAGFFDTRDLVQVKYEMVRAVREDDVPVTQAAAAFGFSRQSYYATAAALEAGGLPALVPAKPGPKKAHKLTAQVCAFCEQQLAPIPLCARKTCQARSRPPSACACTPAPSSERWPGTGSSIPKAGRGRRGTRPRRDRRPDPLVSASGKWRTRGAYFGSGRVAGRRRLALCVRLCGHRVARLTRGGAGDGPALALLNARTAFRPAAMKAYIANKMTSASTATEVQADPGQTLLS
jgi:hypothetical protein